MFAAINLKYIVMEKQKSNSIGGKRSNAGRVIDPLVDWSFKYLLGTEESKHNLIGILNLLLMPQDEIVDVAFMNNESLPASPEHKGCVFDIICEDQKGDKYLVEMQNQQVGNIRERIIFYTCRLIDRMGERGDDWDYADIKKVYTICLMNFTYEESPKLRRDVVLYDVNEGKQFSDKFNIILLQLPCLMVENINDCRMKYEYLLYLLREMHKNMKTIEELKAEVAATVLPEATKEVLYKFLERADIGSLSNSERLQYEAEMKACRDTMSCIRYAEVKGHNAGLVEGVARGREERDIEIARSLKAKGLDVLLISECTGLPEEEITKL